ncbi:hypothetical protein F4U02_10935 [Acinetobacter haemolyticus]|uniref:hypothetical protein n=1 Tax=Acinetobacter haemolyticus TaxID=29430 RepID=UPI0012985C5B|nr:hypothetical protein [Acinetobacter haemolyticus]MQZ31499.1 hypothetical protein [Acinetobacter haemolyticus]
MNSAFTWRLTVELGVIERRLSRADYKTPFYTPNTSSLIALSRSTTSAFDSHSSAITASNWAGVI